DGQAKAAGFASGPTIDVCWKGCRPRMPHHIEFVRLVTMSNKDAGQNIYPSKSRICQPLAQSAGTLRFIQREFGVTQPFSRVTPPLRSNIAGHRRFASF